MRWSHASVTDPPPRSAISVARRLAACLVLAFAVTIAVPGPVAEAKSPPCPKYVALRSTHAVLYTRSDDEELQRLIGCHKRTRRRTELVSWYAQGSSTDDPAPQYWLAGRFAAMNVASCTGGPAGFAERTCTARFRIVDLRTGATHATFDELTSPISDMVLLRSGSAAFIHRRQLFTVIAGQGALRDGVVDSDSLAYASRSGRLYWTSGDQPKTLRMR